MPPLKRKDYDFYMNIIYKVKKRITPKEPDNKSIERLGFLVYVL